MDLLTAISKEYKVEGTPGTWQVFQIKNNQDFPYKIKQKKDEFVLSKGWSPRVNLSVRYVQIAKFKSLDDAYKRIIKKHNTSCKHMANWNTINI